MTSSKHLASTAIVALLLLTAYGCSTTPPPSPPLEPVRVPFFPPQKVMQSGDYSAFLEQNRKALQTCEASYNCDEIIFNLGFVHTYSKSPYYDIKKGLTYFEQLLSKYPESPLAYQARVWIDLVKSAIEAEKKQRNLRNQLKSKGIAINDLQKQIDNLHQQLNDFQTQIKRSRELDLKLDEKERNLFK